MILLYWVFPPQHHVFDFHLFFIWRIIALQNFVFCQTSTWISHRYTYNLIAKFRLKLKKVGKTTRPFRYDLNQIPYDYTVEVRNRFKGLDLMDRVPDELWNEVRDIVQETGIKTISIEKKCRKPKWLSGEALQIAVKRREVKSKGERKDIPIWMQSSKE